MDDEKSGVPMTEETGQVFRRLWKAGSEAAELTCCGTGLYTRGSATGNQHLQGWLVGWWVGRLGFNGTFSINRPPYRAINSIEKMFISDRYS